MADFNTSKVDGDTVAAAEWNQLASVDNFITTSGQTPSTGNLNQMGIGAARYSSGGQFFTDSGTANAYILTSVSPFKAPVSATEGYFNGMTIRFRAGNANSGASIVNVNSAGVKNLKKEDGSTALVSGDIPTDIDVMFRYNGTVFVLVRNAASLPEAITGTNNTKFLTPYLASNLPAFRAAKQTPQNLTHLVATKITGFSVDFDIGSYWNAGTSRYTPPAGKYAFNLTASGVSSVNYGLAWAIYINGVATPYGATIGTILANSTAKLPAVGYITVNGTDYLEIYVTMGYASPATLTLNEVFFEIEKIR
jgi:hypothetical protein